MNRAIQGIFVVVVIATGIATFFCHTASSASADPVASHIKGITPDILQDCGTYATTSAVSDGHGGEILNVNQCNAYGGGVRIYHITEHDLTKAK